MGSAKLEVENCDFDSGDADSDPHFKRQLQTAILFCTVLQRGDLNIVKFPALAINFTEEKFAFNG